MSNLESNNYLLPVDDQLLMRESGVWVADKLGYIERYLEMFTTSMRNKPWRNIRYIDLFAGTGKCFVKDTKQVFLGSALLALTTKHPFTDYIFVDLSKENIEALSKRSSAVHYNAVIKNYIDNSNIVVDDIVKQIKQRDQEFIRGKWRSLNLAVLDPEGLELEWSTVAKLAEIKRMDLIIHYSQFGLTRNMENCYSIQDETVIDRFFGDRQWRSIYSHGRSKGHSYGRIHRDLIDYYKSKLANLGYVDVRNSSFNDEPLMRTGKTNAPLYRLLFASKHKLGKKFWREVTRKTVYGQRTLF